MNRFPGGVTYYTTGILNAEIYFPEDRTVCRYCRLFRYDRDTRQNICPLTGEILLYPDTFIGNQCPLTKKEE